MFGCGHRIDRDHLVVVQLHNPTEGRAYFDAKKAAGKTSMEAMRALKRRLSNIVYAQMVADQKRREATGPGGLSGTTLQSSVTDLIRTSALRISHFPDPPPASLRRCCPTRLDTKGSHERTCPWLRSQLGAEPAKPVRRTVPCSTEHIIRAWIQQRRQLASQ
jgi:hypothetical protein